MKNVKRRNIIKRLLKFGLQETETNSYTFKIPIKIINQTRQVAICPLCKSSMIRKYWIYFFGKTKCINNKCLLGKNFL